MPCVDLLCDSHSPGEVVEILARLTRRHLLIAAATTDGACHWSRKHHGEGSSAVAVAVDHSPPADGGRVGCGAENGVGLGIVSCLALVRCALF